MKTLSLNAVCVGLSFGVMPLYASAQQYTWTGAAGNLWAIPGSWSPALSTAPPNMPGESAVIDNGGTVIQAAGSISGLTVIGSTVEIGSGSPTLTVSASSIHNGGIIRTGNYFNGQSNTLRIPVACQINGSGAIEIDNGGTLSGGSGSIANSPAHTIRSSAATNGTISAHILNQGLIQASGFLNWNSGSLQNHSNVITAPGAWFYFFIPVTQVGAGRLQSAGGYIQVGGPGGSVTGGVLQASGSGHVRFNTGSIAADVTNTGRVLLEGCSLSGSFFNNEAIANSGSGFIVRSNVTMSGPGVLHMSSGATINPDAGVIFTNAADHTIRGMGSFARNFRNEGLISADVNSDSGLSWYGASNTHNGHGLAAYGGRLFLMTNISGTGRWTADTDGMLIIGSSNRHITTTGTVEIRNGGSLVFPNGGYALPIANGCSLQASRLQLESNGALFVDAQNCWINILDALDNALTNASRWRFNWPSNSVVFVPGGACTATLECASADLGQVTSALTNNFAFQNLELASGVGVRLVDNRDNGNRVLPRECVYVAGSLFLGAGSVLDLNGMTLYAGTPPVRVLPGPRNGGMVIDGGEPDCNNNGIADHCDIASGTSVDANNDGIPDSCQVCAADVDDGTGSGMPDGGVTIDDLIFYLNIFDAGDIRTDVDDGTGSGMPDGGVTIDDLIYFLARFDSGC